MAPNDSILIIGQPKSGKTTFLAQFFTRVRKRKSCIKLSKTPGNIKAIIDAERRLAMGEEPQTTPASENVELVLPIEIEDKKLDLICPDYGGEQVKDITDFMKINSNWKKLVNGSDRWMLFIRPDEVITEYDLSVSSYENIKMKKSKEFIRPELSVQSKFIEILQSLLYSKNIGTKRFISKPKLTIVLTCWDELKTKQRPIQVLQEKLPMLLNFVKTVWQSDSFEIFGLSAQEFPLTTQEAKDRYLDELPESFGYLIDKDGEKDTDITKLIINVLR